MKPTEASSESAESTVPPTENTDPITGEPIQSEPVETVVQVETETGSEPVESEAQAVEEAEKIANTETRSEPAESRPKRKRKTREPVPV